MNLESAVYALHVFQKKAKRGTATPVHEIQLVKTAIWRRCRAFRTSTAASGAAVRTTTTRVAAGTGTELVVTASSGNVFADLGLADAEELLAKADLVHAIQRLVHVRKLSQRMAANVVGVAQPDLSRIFRGRLDGFSIERLVRMLNALDQDVRILVQPKANARRRATIRTLVRKKM